MTTASEDIIKRIFDLAEEDELARAVVPLLRDAYAGGRWRIEALTQVLEHVAAVGTENPS